MKKCVWLALIGLSSALFAGASAVAGDLPLTPSAPRPPQYVALAFDGSLNLSFWAESLQFARNTNVKLTYFASGVYFLQNQNKNLYHDPGHSIGYSCIGFGGTDPAAIKARVGFVNQAYGEGNEIASHANGHCSGSSKWTTADWTSEFKQFYDIFFNALGINGIGPNTNPYRFAASEVVGFRAPLLEKNAAMYSVLKDYGYRYDTSGTAATNYWPKKLPTGQWNFPLAQVTIAGTAKHTLSMDYNFYYTQSKGVPDPANSALYEKQMYDTYMAYFASNYNGNRAPVHIGHHFSKWNGGAYWRAMQRFAKDVCSLPEVKCVTYRELADYMDSTVPAAQTLAFQNMSFARLVPSAKVKALTADIPTALDMNLVLKVSSNRKGIDLVATGTDADRITHNSNTLWLADGKIATSMTSALEQLRGKSGTLSLHMNYEGREVATATHEVSVNSAGEITSLSERPLEERALDGDMNEAHAEEEN